VATSGSDSKVFNGRSQYTLRIEWQRVSVNAALRQTTIKYRCRITESPENGSWVGSGFDWAVWINGTKVASGSRGYDFRNYNELVLKGWTNLVIQHNSSGNANISFRAKGSGGVLGTADTGTTTQALDRIPAQAPSAPQSFALVSESAGSFKASWSAPASNGGGAITGYDLQYSFDDFATSTLLTNVTSPRTVSGLTPGSTPKVRVRAKNSDAAGAWTTAAPIQTKAAAPSAPAKPSLMSPAPGKLTVTWSPPSSNGGRSLSGYDLRHAANEAMTDDVVTLSLGTSASPHTLADLAPGQTRYVQVRAKNADATGGWSAVAAATVLAGLYVSDGEEWAGVGPLAAEAGAFVPLQALYSDPVTETWLPAA